MFFCSKKAKNILKHIPQNPNMGSFVNIAYTSGYLCEPYSGENLEYCLKKFEKALAWLTVSTDCKIIEKTYKTQKKTISLLKEKNIVYDKPYMRYLSVLPEEKGELQN